MANSKRKCKHCLEYIKATSGIKVPAGFFCDIDHATEFAQAKRDAEREKQKAKVKREVVKKEKAARSDLREFRNNDKSHQLRLAQKNFNKFIRLRDKGEPCISCGKPDNGSHQRHASHYRSVGACSSLRFSELNVWASCSVCNNHLSGNIGEYRLALINKIGIEKVEWLESQPKAMKLSAEEVVAIKNKYAKLAAELE